MIRRRIADLAAFDVIRYAQKACSNLAILDLVRRSGALVDAVSAGEIRRALAAGFSTAGDPPPIVYTADLFDAAALDLCVARGVHVNCGSPDMIDQLGGRAPGGSITLRILLATCYETTTYLDRYYSMHPGRLLGSKRLVVLLSAEQRSAAGKSWRESVAEYTTCISTF